MSDAISTATGFSPTESLQILTSRGKKDWNSRFNKQSTETSSDGPDPEGPTSFEDIAKCVTRARKAGSSISITAADVEVEYTRLQSANDCDFDEMKYKEETLAQADNSASTPKSKSRGQTASKGPSPGHGKPKNTTAAERSRDKDTAPPEPLTTVQKWMLGRRKTIVASKGPPKPKATRPETKASAWMSGTSPGYRR
ncbi:MAG: hypothetical protein Q9172_003926 [Xanthocarpia lactea]